MRPVLKILMLGDLTREKKGKRGKGVKRGEERRGVFPLIFCLFALGEVENCCKNNSGENGCPFETVCWKHWDKLCDKEITDEQVISFLMGFKSISKGVRG